MRPRTTSGSLSQAVGQAFYGAFSGLHAVQDAAIGPILAGNDVLVLSGTGSGKTEAIMAPLVDRCRSAGWFDGGGITVLYVTPTRALANDLFRRLSPPLEQLGIVLGVRHGEQDDISRKQKPDVLITTPESVDVLLFSRHSAIARVRVVVVDEAHLFYNTQRGFQLAVLLRRLKAFTGIEQQVVAASATIADPLHIWAFLRPGVPVVVVRDGTSRDIDFFLRSASAPEELRALMDAVHAGRRAKVLIFTNSRREADSTAAALRGHTKFGERVYAHHSSLSRHTRLDVEAEFGAPGKALCVATSTLELGIDIGDIDLVVLYGHPGGWEAFLQRIGRGNRRSSKANVIGVAVLPNGPLFVQQLAFEALFRQVKAGTFTSEAPQVLFGAGLQQMLSALASQEGSFVRVRDLLAPFDAWAAAYSPELVERLLVHAAGQDLVLRHGFLDRVAAGPGLHRLRDLMLVWGNFPMASRQIPIAVGSRELARIPAINAVRLRPAAVISLGGRSWLVRRVTTDRVEVEPSNQRPTMRIMYGGSKPPIDPSNILEMLRFIWERAKPEGLVGDDRVTFERRLESLAQSFVPGSIPVAKTPGGYCYFTFAGRHTNRVIACVAGREVVAVGELYLETAEPLDFHLLSRNAEDHSDLAARAVDSPLDLTIYQSFLPVDVLALEVGRAWSSSPVTTANMQRLLDSHEVDVPGDEWLDLRW